MRITAIEKQERRRRANLFLDGRFALALGLEVIAQFGLRVGDELTAEGIEGLRQADVRQRALNSALRLLSYRPRSQAEMRQRLAQKGLPPAVIDDTIQRLQELGLLDDSGFARYWVESRDQASPRGRRLLAQELRLKGIERETIQEAVAPVDEGEAAYRAARRRAQRLQGIDYPTFRRKLGDFLLRRGFDFPLVGSTIQRLWRERGEARGPEEDAIE